MADHAQLQGWRRTGRHYVLLLWKNIVLAKRTPIRTFLEIVLPVFFGFLLLSIRRIVKSETFKDDTRYHSFSVDQLPDFQTIFVSYVGYSPNTSFTKDVMDRAAANLGLFGNDLGVLPK